MGNCCSTKGKDHGHKHHGHHNKKGCCCESSFRKFITKKEQIQKLEGYKKELELELQAVKERIDDLK